MARHRIVIAEDHPLMLASIEAVLAGADGFQLVAAARSGEELLSLVGDQEPDVVLLDLRMPGMSGIDCLEQIKARHPDTRQIVLSACEDPHLVETALSRGADGYIVKTVDSRGLLDAIEAALDGSGYEPVRTTENGELSHLTPREVEILTAVARGLSNRAIGRELWVTEQTVKFHLANIYRKLGVGNRTQAAGWALRHGLVELA